MHPVRGDHVLGHCIPSGKVSGHYEKISSRKSRIVSMQI
jgi:hypothetical protein